MRLCFRGRSGPFRIEITSSVLDALMRDHHPGMTVWEATDIVSKRLDVREDTDMVLGACDPQVRGALRVLFERETVQKLLEGATQ